MAIVKSEYNVLNPTSGGYDTHYLKTDIGQVDGLRGELDSMSGDITTLIGDVETLSDGKLNITGGTFGGSDNKYFTNNNATSAIVVRGGTSSTDGGYIRISGKDESGNLAGSVILHSTNGTNSADLILYGDGTTYVPTPATNDNSTKIATTNYCKNLLNTHFKRTSTNATSATFTFERGSGSRADQYLLITSQGTWRIYVNTINPAITRIEGSSTATISASESGSKMTITITISSTCYGGMLLIGDILDNAIVV